jgi:hypothetical protein
MLCWDHRLGIRNEEVYTHHQVLKQPHSPTKKFPHPRHRRCRQKALPNTAIVGLQEKRVYLDQQRFHWLLPAIPQVAKDALGM